MVCPEGSGGGVRDCTVASERYLETIYKLFYSVSVLYTRSP